MGNNTMQIADISRPADTELTEAQLMRRLTWRIVPLLAVCWVVNWIDRTNIGFARFGFQDSLGVSQTQLGMIIGIYSVGYLLFEVPSNLLLERYGARRTLTRILFLWGLISILTAFARNGTELMLVRLALGFAEAGFFPGAILYMTYWFPSTYRARITSRFIIANAVAGIVGAPLAGWIMTNMAHVGPFEGWQWLFVLEGIPPILLAAVVWFYLCDKPENAKWLSKAELGLLRDALKRDGDEKPASAGAAHGFLAVIRDKSVYLLAIGFCFTIMCTGNVVQFWAPSIIRDAGVGDVMKVGWLSAAPWAIGVVVMLLVAWSSDRLKERRWHFLTLGVVVGIAMLALPTFSHSVTGAVLTLSVLTSAYLGAIGIFWTISAQYLSPAKRAAGVAVINTLGQLGGLLAPNLIAGVQHSTGDLSLALLLIGVIVLLGVVAVFVGTRKKQQA